MNFDYSRIDFRFASTISEIETLIKETPKGFKEEIEAYHSRLIQLIDFFTEEANDYHGKFQSQRNRFNIWYDKTYLKPFLEKDPRYKWAADTIRADSDLSKNDLHMPLEKAYSEVGI